MTPHPNIPRNITPVINKKLWQGKGIVIYGARRVGKTTLVKTILANTKRSGMYLTCDDITVRSALTDAGFDALTRLFGNNQLIIIDEAQRVRDIGVTLKLAIDNMPDKQIIATGSSSFELANQIAEPLTGRVFTFRLSPFAFSEISLGRTPHEASIIKDSALIFGMYPEAITDPSAAESTLREIVGGQLYRDALEYQGIRNPDKLRRLLEALALQIGHEVSYNELAGLISLNRLTVEKYLDLLEKSFILFRLRPLARNKRTELRRPQKIFFYDNGVRNALINNFNPLKLRNDLGQLWENWLIAERQKMLHNRYSHVSNYFWRTREGAEVDYIEEASGRMDAYEIKLQAKPNQKVSQSFTETYPDATTRVIDTKNFTTFLT